jgi:hypothetical protein
VEADGSTADVVHDEVAVMDNLRVVSEFDELEIELVDGVPDGLEQIEVAVRRAGRATATPGRRSCGSSATVVPRSPPVRSCRPTSSASTSKILAHDPGTRSATIPRTCTTSVSPSGDCAPF